MPGTTPEPVSYTHLIMQRENFKSRLGFLLISAGCAIGIGNVWRFPYVVGQNGGGAFVLLYVLFLVTVGVPVLTMEFAIGRASRKSLSLIHILLNTLLAAAGA